MKIRIETQGFELTEALREHVLRRLRYALGRYAHDVRRVAVHLSDVNGPRGGADKLCRILVRLPPSPLIVIKDLGSDLYQVIDRAAERADRNIARRIGRMRQLQVSSRGGHPALPAAV